MVDLAYALSGSRAGAEDIAQEAFLRAYRAWDRVRSYEHQAAWIRRVAANLATSGLRRRLVEARALARLAARREPALDPLPASNADFWRAVRALPPARPRRSPCTTWRTCCAATAAAAPASRGRRHPRPRGPGGGRLGRSRPARPDPIQPTLGPVTRIRVGPGPVSVTVTRDAAWVLNAGDSTISRIDPRTGRVQASYEVFGAVGRGGLAFATVAEGRLWVVHGSGWNQSAISVIDPSTGRTLNTFGVGDYALQSMGTPGNLAVGAGTVWAALHGADEVKGTTPPPASCWTGSRCQSRPRWLWTARRCGSPASMGGYAASTSTPVGWRSAPPPTW